MQVSFVIPLFNGLTLTQAMVASLQASLPAGLTHEIILVDDGSTDGTRQWLATLSAPFQVVLHERNLGYAAANNRGAGVARGEILALLNNDLVLPPGWLEPMLAAHRRLGSRAGLVGNVQRTVATGAVDHAGIALNLKGKLEHIRTLPIPLFRFLFPVQSVAAVTGACLLLDRALWQELGGFDENFINGSEDVDLCLRALNASRVNVVILRSVVLHHVSASLGRKVHDEENTYRFTRHWRHELRHLVDRAWCWRYLEAYWPSMSDPAGHVAVRRMLAYILHLRCTPPSEALLALDTAIESEMVRWQEMFGPPPRT